MMYILKIRCAKFDCHICSNDQCMHIVLKFPMQYMAYSFQVVLTNWKKDT